MTRPGTTFLGFGLALWLASQVAVAQSAELGNLAPNPDLEIADGLGPAFWEQRTPTDKQRTLSWDADASKSGRRSVKIENHDAVTSRWRTGHLRDMALKPGSEGLLTAWLKTSHMERGAYLKLYFMTAGDGIAAQPQSQPVTGTSAWTEVRLPFVVPDETAYVMIYLELNGTGTAWYDDVVLNGTPGEAAIKLAAPTLTYAAVDFEGLDNCRLREYGRRNVLELPVGPGPGRAQVIAWGESARYDLAVSFASQPQLGTMLKVLVNDEQVARWPDDDAMDTSDTKESFREQVIRGLDVQRLSRVAIAVQGKACRVEKLMLTPRGRFQGTFLPKERLRLQPRLRLYEMLDERRNGRAMLGRFISDRLAPLAEQRDSELAGLKSPDEWQRRQQATRTKLKEFLGDFGPKCPLNARIVGRIDRPDYVIEKLIFESQPGYHVTANIYVPKRREFPVPGVLFTCGHAGDGKAYHLYHECCLGLVLKGYVVLALDPMGQGERSEYFDPDTGEPRVPLNVSQHHYLARPSWLVGRSLAGYRTWDCIRALDYLVTRSEVDADQIASVGNSGGGIMALLITAADERVKVCAAAHPGGSMEQTFLTGRRITEADILSLIPPRPCLFIVGKDSGEEAGHRRKMDEMLPFYAGLGVGSDRCRMVLVDGVHNMEKPKREPAYGWLNLHFDKEEEGANEPPLIPETVEDLRCTATGLVVRDLDGETGQTLNAKVADALHQPRSVPDDIPSIHAAQSHVARVIRERIGLDLPENRDVPESVLFDSYEADEFTAEKLELVSEPGIRLPSLLLVPRRTKPKEPILLHVAEAGKPTNATTSSLALELVRRGYMVFSTDVRGAGETDPRERATMPRLESYHSQQFGFDSSAVQAAQLGTTLLAMRACDLVRAIDYLESRADLVDRPIVLVGEGLGGVWVLTAAAFDPRPAGVICVGMVPSYKLITGSQYYRSRDYFWVNGALKDFDLPDMIGLLAPRRAVLLNPVDAMLEPLDKQKSDRLCDWPGGIYENLGVPEQFSIVYAAADTARHVDAALEGFEVSIDGRGKSKRK